MNRFVLSAIAAVVSFGTVFGLSTGVASAVTGIEKVDTPSLIESFTRIINDRLEAIGEQPVRWDIQSGVSAQDINTVSTSTPIPVSLSLMEGRRSQSQLAPLVELSMTAMMRVQQVTAHATNSELGSLSAIASRACFAGSVLAFVERVTGFKSNIVDDGAFNRIITSGVAPLVERHSVIKDGFAYGIIYGATACDGPFN